MLGSVTSPGEGETHGDRRHAAYLIRDQQTRCARVGPGLLVAPHAPPRGGAWAET